eukprot:6375606-Prymnesium_polylepis.1
MTLHVPNGRCVSSWLALVFTVSSDRVSNRRQSGHGVCAVRWACVVRTAESATLYNPRPRVVRVSALAAPTGPDRTCAETVGAKAANWLFQLTS